MDERLSSELLSRPGAVPDSGDDAPVAGHYGDPTREQRALEQGSAVVDLSNRSVVTVSGPDRLSWLSTLSSQQIAGLKPGEPTELLLLDISGRIEHDAAVIDDGETVWLITEGSHGAVLAQWLDSMKFMLRVEITDRSAEYAVLGSMAALPEATSPAPQIVWEDPWPQLGVGAASYAEIEESQHPGSDWSWRLSLVPRDALGAVIDSILQAGWMLAGTMASEALRIAAWRPRLAREVDEKAIPHELDLIRTAVHLSKGCYKGQETVARVHNLGHPPRRLVFLHLDGSEHTLPAIGSDVLAASAEASPEELIQERAVGKITSVGRHHEMGPIALALVKRKVDPALQLVVRDGAEEPSFYAAAQEIIVRPDAGQAVGRPQGDFLRKPRR